MAVSTNIKDTFQSEVFRWEFSQSNSHSSWYAGVFFHNFSFFERKMLLRFNFFIFAKVLVSTALIFFCRRLCKGIEFWPDACDGDLPLRYSTYQNDDQRSAIRCNRRLLELPPQTAAGGDVQFRVSMLICKENRVLRTNCYSVKRSPIYYQFHSYRKEGTKEQMTLHGKNTWGVPSKSFPKWTITVNLISERTHDEATGDITETAMPKLTINPIATMSGHGRYKSKREAMVTLHYTTPRFSLWSYSGTALPITSHASPMEYPRFKLVDILLLTCANTNVPTLRLSRLSEKNLLSSDSTFIEQLLPKPNVR